MGRSSRSLASLAALLVLGGVGWALSRGSPPHAPPPPKPPDDDLEMLAAILEDASPGRPPRDLLAAGATDLYVAHGASGVLEAFPRAGGAKRVVARLGGPVWALAASGSSLFVATGSAVVRVPVAGGEPVRITEAALRPRAVATDGTSVFVVDVEQTSGLLPTSVVLRVPASGGHAEEVGRYQGEVTNVVLDDASAYWADTLDGTLLAAPLVGGPPRALASDRGLPGQVAVDAASVYWIEMRSESLWAVAKSGGRPRELVQDFAGFTNLTPAGASVAWVDEAAVDGAFRVLRVPTGGGDAVAASPPARSIDAIAWDGTRLFWLRDGEASEVPAAP